MKIQKKLLLLLFVFVMGINLCACGKNDNNKVKKQTYAITYLNTKDIKNPNPTSYKTGDIIELKNLDDTSNALFLGWYNANDEKVEIIDKSSTGEIKLTAKWQDASLKYLLVDDSYYEVIGIGDFINSKTIIIPDTYNNLPVKSIAEYSFSSKVSAPNDFDKFYSFNKVIIGNNVEKIGNSAFAFSVNLYSVTVGEKVFEIDEYAFDACPHLVEIYNLSSLELELNSDENGGITLFAKDVYTSNNEKSKLVESNNVIYYKNGVNKILIMPLDVVNVVNVEIDSDCTEINSFAFYPNVNMTKLVIPNRVKTLKAYSIYAMNLRSVVIGSGVKTIEEDAFECDTLIEVYNLSSLVIVAGVGEYSDVKDVYTSLNEESKINISGGVIYYVENNKKIAIGVEKICDEIDIVIDSDCDEIGEGAFSDSLIKSVKIPESVKTIGEGAFRYCQNLTKVVIPNSVSKIKLYTFNGCINLTTLVIGSGVTEIETFEGSPLISFEGCYHLVEIYNLSSLKIVAGSSDYGGIAYYAKDVYTSLDTQSKLIESKGVIYYKNNTDFIAVKVLDCDAQTIVLDNNCTEILKYAFSGYYGYSVVYAKAIVIPSTITKIGEYAFYDSDNLINVYYYGNVSEMSKISIGNNNNYFKSAAKYSYSENEPTTSGSYWHYVNGEPVLW